MTNGVEIRGLSSCDREESADDPGLIISSSLEWISTTRSDLGMGAVLSRYDSSAGFTLWRRQSQGCYKETVPS